MKLELLPIHTATLGAHDALEDILMSQMKFEDGDILVVSSKVCAVTEGHIISLGSVTPSGEATAYAQQTGRSPEFMQAVLDETLRLNGKVSGTCPGALLTEVRPAGLPVGSILTANAGLDESNTPHGTTIGWPRDPVKSGNRIRMGIEHGQQKKVGVIISDSCCRPRRWGVTAFALTVSGFEPLSPQAGRKDLFGRELRITTEAISDQLATAGNFLMGNADQATPAVVIRGAEIPLSDTEGWVPGIEPEEDLFKGII